MAKSTSDMVMRHGLMMRDKFPFSKHNMTSWFPGHMEKGMKTMSQKLVNLDFLIEVHDARIPITGRNPFFEKHFSLVKPSMLILNKVDLIPKQHTAPILEYYKRQGNKNVLFTNCKTPHSQIFKDLLPKVQEMIDQSNRYNRSHKVEFSIMVIGVPNVGKSSLINALRLANSKRGKATHVGAEPGITRSVLERIKLLDEPAVYVLDTPGVLQPTIRNVQVGLKLALANTIKEHLVGEHIIADYLLFRLNAVGNHSYVDHFGLEDPTDNFEEFIFKACVRNNYIMKIRSFSGKTNMEIVPNKKLCSFKFLQAYRGNVFGRFLIDEPMMFDC